MQRYIPFVLSIFLLFASCVWFSPDEAIEVPVGISADSSEYEEYVSCVSQCGVCEENCLNTVYYVRALEGSDTRDCDKIMSQTLREDCEQTLLVAEAIEQLNKDKCMMLSEEAVQQSCLVHVAAEAAVQSGSSEKCTESPDVERCEAIFYRDMALFYNDAGYCDNLQSEENKELCYFLVSEKRSE